jgi:uncharacterized protein (TIGR02246 family)
LGMDKAVSRSWEKLGPTHLSLRSVDRFSRDDGAFSRYNTSGAISKSGVGMTRTYGNDADLKAIDRVRDDHVAALNAGNADTWVAQFTEDGVQMPPNTPANAGKDNIKTWAHGMLSQFRTTFDLSVDEVRILGDWAFECGGYSIKLNPIAGGPTIEDKGKYITIYQKSTGNGWKMARDIWNSSLPLPQM